MNGLPASWSVFQKIITGIVPTKDLVLLTTHLLAEEAELKRDKG
jgi:hypothetical protein